MSRQQLKKDILEAKRWDELVGRVRQMVAKHGAPTIAWMGEQLDCSFDILHNIGDTVDGLQIVGDPSNQGQLRVTSAPTEAEQN